MKPGSEELGHFPRTHSSLIAIRIQAWANWGLILSSRLLHILPLAVCLLNLSDRGHVVPILREKFKKERIKCQEAHTNVSISPLSLFRHSTLWKVTLIDPWEEWMRASLRKGEGPAMPYCSDLPEERPSPQPWITYEGEISLLTEDVSQWKRRSRWDFGKQQANKLVLWDYCIMGAQRSCSNDNIHNLWSRIEFEVSRLGEYWQ